MFEKEAEEYKDNTRIKDKNTYIGFPDERISEVQDYEGNYIDISERIIKTFKDGAEFGYNKAKEEYATELEEVVETCNHWQEVAEKANEWHFVKDELPISDKDKYYFVVDKWNEPMIARFYEGVWSNYSTIEDVIAWKEIVLPEGE